MSACRLQPLLLLPSHGLASHAATAATDTGACPLPVCPCGSGSRKAKGWPLHILWLLKPAHSVCLTCELLPVSMAVSCMQQAVVAATRPHAHCSTCLEAGQIVVVTKLLDKCTGTDAVRLRRIVLTLSQERTCSRKGGSLDSRTSRGWPQAASRAGQGDLSLRERRQHDDAQPAHAHQQSEFATKFVFAALFMALPHWSQALA